MRTSKYSEEKKSLAFAPKQKGMPIGSAANSRAFDSDASFYKWRAKFAGMDAIEAKRLRGLDLSWRTASSSGCWRGPRHPRA